jgi:hypothetical protein
MPEPSSPRAMPIGDFPNRRHANASGSRFSRPICALRHDAILKAVSAIAANSNTNGFAARQ